MRTRMPYQLKFPAAAVVGLALAITPVALARSGASVTTTPTRAVVGHTVQMLIKGMKPGEKVSGKEYAPFGQTRTVVSKKLVNAQGALIFSVVAQVKGTHRWVFTGRQSHRTAKTAYYVK